MLLYNWKRIFNTCNARPTEIVRVIKMLVYKEIPVNRFDKLHRYSAIDFSGGSFLAHPDILLDNSYKYSYRDICIYLSVASLRSYGQYKASGKTTLDELHLTFDPFKYLNNTRLLYRSGSDIHFLYEEVTTENK